MEEKSFERVGREKKKRFKKKKVRGERGESSKAYDDGKIKRPHSNTRQGDIGRASKTILFKGKYSSANRVL